MAAVNLDSYHPVQPYQSVVASTALLSVPKRIKGHLNPSRLHNIPHSMTQNTVAKLAWLVKRIEAAAERPDWHAQDWVVLRTDCERLSAAALSSPDPVVKKCSIILGDILVRIRLLLDSGANAVERTWSVDDLVVLNQRLHEVQREDSGPRTIGDVVEDEDKPVVKKKKQTTDYNPRSERFTMLTEFVLDGLAFTAMNDREDQVTEAYRNTFDWIFRNGSHSFPEWLQMDDTESIYWITGLAGSGKSTLMRYISIDGRFEDLLQVWGGETQVVTANFFFWESGTAVQRSQAGLLRSLLHKLLSQYPQFIPDVFPELWAEMWHGDARTRIRLTATWPITRLDSAFRNFFEIKGDLKVCLLVDGLDEFEGDHQSLIDLFRYISRFPSTKVCVSSRPWPVFQRAFGDVPGLRVQDLTAGDMRRVVYGELRADPRVSNFLVQDTQTASEIIAEVVLRADGVFLWTTLAIRTLLRSFAPKEGLSGLLSMLRHLPRTLDDLYHYLLFQAKPSDGPTISRILQLMRAREIVCDFTRDDDATGLTIWEMALTDDADKETALAAPIHKVHPDDMLHRCEGTTLDIQNTCSGLVEVHANRKGRLSRLEVGMDAVKMPSASKKISYMHRTVKDFLANTSIWDKIVAYYPTIDPHVCHLRASVLALKLRPEEPRQRRSMLNEWWGGVVLTMTHARHASAASHQEVFDLLNTYDDTLNWYFPPRQSVSLDSWARSCFGTYEERAFTPYPDPFLSLTTKFGVARYVEDYLDTYEYEYVEEKPLLSYAVEYLVHRQSTVYPLASPEIVQILFNNGQDPNLARRSTRPVGMHHHHDDESEPASKKQKPPMKTPWILALEAVQQAHRRGWIERYDVDPNGVPRWTAILKLFLKHGANANVTVQATYRDKSETAIHLMTRVFNAYYSKDMEEVLALFRAAKVRSAAPKN